MMFSIEHMSLLRRHARRLLRSAPYDFELMDLVQFGAFGLLRALESFRPDCGASFDTFASIRIRGAILDAIRSASFLPRSELDRRRASGGDVRLEFEPLSESAFYEIAARFDYSDAIDLRSAILSLSEPDRGVIIAHYFLDLDMTKIGANLGVTGARVGQIKDRALSVIFSRIMGADSPTA